MFGREHARTHRLVHALDLRHVERAAGVADQQGTRHLERRHRLPAALDDRARAVGDQFAAVEQRLQARMILELLERLERLEARVRVIEADDEADVEPVLVELVEEAAAVSLAVHREADGVLDQARFDATLGQLPQFLEAEAIRLRRFARVETKASDQLLGNAAAATFGEDRRLRANLRTGCEVVAGIAILVETHVADLHADDRAIVASNSGCAAANPANTSTPRPSAFVASIATTLPSETMKLP